MPTRNKSCCFTGHRPEKLPWKNNESDPRCIDLKSRIFDSVEALYHSGITHYICGMAAGSDLYFAEAVIDLRNSHPEITLEAAIPWDGQADSWSSTLKARYYRIAEDCDFQTLVTVHYSPDCLMKRNRYMVDSSSVIIAAYGGAAGGTMKTMLYAMRQGLRVIELPL